MERRAVSLVAAVAGILLTGASSAGAGVEKTYWIGKGEDRGSRVEFIVNEGKVRELLTVTGPVRCTDDRRTSLAKGWDDFRLSDRSFEEREQYRNGAAFFVAGHIRGQSASGRLKSKVMNGEAECESDFVRWTAEQVTREEWQEAHEH